MSTKPPGGWILPLLAIALALTAGCARLLIPADDVPLRAFDGYFPRGEWRTSTPEAQGLDSQALSTLFDTIQARGLPIHSLQIVRYGHLVLDAYFFPFPRDSRHDLASITKSVTSTLVGMALQRGVLPSLETPVFPLLDPTAPADGRKREIRLRHLLTNSSGLDCGRAQFEPETLAMAASADWVRFALDLPLGEAPGRRFAYCSPGFHLLSALIQRSSGLAAEDFARSNLFAPLGITDVRWPRDPQGISRGSGDLQLRPADLLKVGYLFLRRGEWDGQRVIAEPWIDQATRRQIEPETSGSEGYGFGWWVSGDLPGLYQAAGRGGQRLIVWPEKDIVVVSTAGGFDPAALAPFLLRALKSNAALPENPAGHSRLLDRVRAAAAPVETHEPAPPLPARAQAIDQAVFALDPNPLETGELKILFLDRSAAEVRLRRPDGEMVFPVGLAGAYRFGVDPASKERVAGRGRWSGPDDFLLEIDLIARINHFTLWLHFENDRVLVRVRERAGLVPEMELTGLRRR